MRVSKALSREAINLWLADKPLNEFLGYRGFVPQGEHEEWLHRYFQEIGIPGAEDLAISNLDISIGGDAVLGSADQGQQNDLTPFQEWLLAWNSYGFTDHGYEEITPVRVIDLKAAIAPDEWSELHMQSHGRYHSTPIRFRQGEDFVQNCFPIKLARAIAFRIAWDLGTVIYLKKPESPAESRQWQYFYGPGEGGGSHRIMQGEPDGTGTYHSPRQCLALLNGVAALGLTIPRPEEAIPHRHCNLLKPVTWQNDSFTEELVY